jgi:hypothetical protein
VEGFSNFTKSSLCGCGQEVRKYPEWRFSKALHRRHHAGGSSQIFILDKLGKMPREGRIMLLLEGLVAPGEAHGSLSEFAREVFVTVMTRAAPLRSSLAMLAPPKRAIGIVLQRAPIRQPPAVKLPPLA